MLCVVKENECIFLPLLISLPSRLTEAKIDIFSKELKCVP